MQDRNSPERAPRPRKRARVGGHAAGPEGAPLCGATPQEPNFSDPPTCSQCRSVQAREAGVVKKKKNRVKGKHAKGPKGGALCGVEAKKVHYSKTPSCTDCQALLGPPAPRAPAPRAESTPGPSAAKRARAAAKAKAKEAKKAAWVFKPCPVCEASIAEHRLDRHMRKVHSGVGREPD